MSILSWLLGKPKSPNWRGLGTEELKSSLRGGGHSVKVGEGRNGPNYQIHKLSNSDKNKIMSILTDRKQSGQTSPDLDALPRKTRKLYKQFDKERAEMERTNEFLRRLDGD